MRPMMQDTALALLCQIWRDLVRPSVVQRRRRTRPVCPAARGRRRPDLGSASPDTVRCTSGWTAPTRSPTLPEGDVQRHLVASGLRAEVEGCSIRGSRCRGRSPEASRGEVVRVEADSHPPPAIQPDPEVGAGEVVRPNDAGMSRPLPGLPSTGRTMDPPGKADTGDGRGMACAFLVGGSGSNPDHRSTQQKIHPLGAVMPAFIDPFRPCRRGLIGFTTVEARVPVTMPLRRRPRDG